VLVYFKLVHSLLDNDVPVGLRVVDDIDGWSRPDHVAVDADLNATADAEHFGGALLEGRQLVAVRHRRSRGRGHDRAADGARFDEGLHLLKFGLLIIVRVVGVVRLDGLALLEVVYHQHESLHARPIAIHLPLQLFHVHRQLAECGQHVLGRRDEGHELDQAVLVKEQDVLPVRFAIWFNVRVLVGGRGLRGAGSQRLGGVLQNQRFREAGLPPALRTLLAAVPRCAATADTAMAAATSTVDGETAAAVDAAAAVETAAEAAELTCTAPARGRVGVADRCGRRRPPARRRATTSAWRISGERLPAAAKATPAWAVPVVGMVTKPARPAPGKWP